MEATALPRLPDLELDEDGWIRRNGRGRVFGAVAAAVNGLFYAAIVVLALSAAESPREFLFGVGMGALLFGWIIWLSFRTSIRILRAGVRIGGDEIVVLGPVRTWRVPVQDAVRFLPGHQPSGFAGEVLRSTHGVLLERSQGRPVSVWALHSVHWTGEAGTREGAERWQPVADWMNELLDGRRDRSDLL
jgi:hypothetical protein